jgi:hypothetical protein
MLDNCDMLEELDAIDNGNDFIWKMTLVIQMKKKRMPHMSHPQLLTLCLTVKTMTWMMKTTPKFCQLSNLSLLLSNSKNCLDLSICLFLILLVLLASISSSQTRSLPS